MYKDRELLKKAHYNDRDYDKLKAAQDKQKEQRKAEKKRLERQIAQQNYVPEDDPIYKGIAYIGKGIYKLSKEATEAGKIAGTTLINAYKITNGSIEVVNTDTDSKTQETIENSESNNTTASNSNSMVATTTKLAKGAIEVGKTTATTLLNAYKISTNSTEIVNTDANGKTQVVIKKPEPNTANSNNNSTTTISTATTTVNTKQDCRKPIEIENKQGEVYSMMYEEEITTSLKFIVNKKYLIKVEKYRAILVPDYIKSGVKLDVQLYLSYPHGVKILEKNAAYLKIYYNDDGKIAKLALPNNPTLSFDPKGPALIMYRDQIYTLPVNSGHYEHLTQEIHKNGGEVLIGHADPAYHIEAIYG